MEFLRALRYDVPLSFMLVDLDEFARMNEEHGRLAADRALVAIAKMLREGMREHDLVARVGEDSFGVLLPHTPEDGACVLAQRLRRRLESTPVTFGRGKLAMRASFGVSGVPSVGVVRAEDLRRRASEALARAKREGGNRVVRYVAG